MSEWQPIETAPKDGRPIWAYLYQSGIRKVQWIRADALASFEGYVDSRDWLDSFVECANWREAWEPQYWLPLSAIPEPPQ